MVPALANVEDNRGVNDPPAAAESVRADALLHKAFPGALGVPAIVVSRDRRGLTGDELGWVNGIAEALRGPGRPASVIR